MSTYGLVLLFSAIGPVVFSFHKKISFYKQWVKVIFSSLLVSIPFIIWDAIATARGDWGFNKKYVGTLKIAGLPIEEIMFFIIIPYCCLFIWHLLKKQQREIVGCCSLKILMSLVFFMGAVALKDKFYTSTILAWAVLTIIVVQLLDRGLFRKIAYWQWLAITFIPFFLVNGILTYLPIVWYSNQAILGIRVVSIPVEDFLYSWSLLTLNLVIYKKILGINLKKIK